MIDLSKGYVMHDWMISCTVIILQWKITKSINNRSNENITLFRCITVLCGNDSIP